jgi:hypothetical protein
MAVIFLLRSDAKEQGFVVSPAQSELAECHRRNWCPGTGTAVTVPRVPSSLILLIDGKPQAVSSMMT